MGGKQKQAQRTKNNARPSSSGRSAELLGSSIPQFTGFSAIKDIPFSLPSYTLAAMEDIDGNIDANFQLVLKKMNKKDSTTKLKALQEFTDLVKSSDQEAVKAILVFWARVYCILATDVEHKVREATHLAHHQVVLKVKRNLAPFLKQLIGPWFTSQYDTYPPAATAATKSFEDAFPSKKSEEAIVFCQEEILNYILENLTIQTKESLNITNASDDDAKAKYDRVVISSLHGYTLYLHKVSTESIEKVQELNIKIVSNKKFWKFSKHGENKIRAAWYNVLTAICQKASFLLRDEVGIATNAVFGNLDESEPLVLTAVWEAALLTITALDKWWSYINVEKLLLPKLYKVLREAGQGNAAVIFPNLLPFLSHLPPNIDVDTFYFNYFDNLRSGLKQKSSLSSRSESSAICVTYIECLQYIIMTNQSNIFLCEKLIKTELLPTIEWCFVETQSAYKALFNRISSLVQYWHRNRNVPDYSSNYSKYLDYFWSNIESLFEGLLMNLEQKHEKNALSELALKQIEFLMSLKHITKPKKQTKVQFSSERLMDNPDHSPTKTKDKCDSLYLDSLHTLAFKICKMYVKFINEKLSKELIEHLLSLIIEFESKDFFTKLSELIKDKDRDQPAKLIDIYDCLLSKWLRSGYMCMQSVVALIFILLKYTGDEEKLKILQTFECLPMEHFGWCLESALSHPHSADHIIKEWLSNSKVDNYLVTLADGMVNDKCNSGATNLLKMAFGEGNSGELSVSVKAVTKIIEIICRCLENPSDYEHTLDDMCCFAAFLCSILYNENSKLKYGSDLLITVFKLLCNTRFDKETLTDDSRWELQTAALDALESLASVVDGDQLTEIVNACSSVTENELLKYDNFDIDLMYNLIVSLIKSVSSDGENSFVAELVLNRNFVPDWRHRITEMCVTAEYLNGTLSSPFEKINVQSEPISSEDILKFFVYMELRARVFATCLSQFSLRSDGGDDSELLDTFTNDENVKIEDDFVIDITHNESEILAYLLYDFTLAKAFKENFKSIKIYDQLNRIIDTTFESIQTLATKSDEMRPFLLMKLTEESWLWTRTIFNYHLTFRKHSIPSTFGWYADQARFTNDTSLSRIHMTQVFAYCLESEEISVTTPLFEEIVNLRCLMHREGAAKRLREVFAKIENLKVDLGDRFYELNFAIWKDIELSTEILRLCTVVITSNEIEQLDPKYWDFVVVSLASWCSKITDVKVLYKNIQIAAFISAICELLVAVENYLKNLEANDANSNKVKEWKDVFAQDAHTDITEVWQYLSEQFLKQVPIKLTMIPLLQHFGKAITVLDYKYIFDRATERTPKWSKLVKQCCSLLINQSNVLQLWGYEMLKTLGQGLVEIDSQSVKTNTPHEKGLVFEQFKDVLKKTQDIVLILLGDMKIGEDSCRVEPFTDSYTYTFAYGLLWDILLTLCEKSSTELRYQYSDWLRNQNFLGRLLDNIFKLMPVEVVHYNDSKNKPFYDYFTKKFDLSTDEPISSAKVERIVCWVFAVTLSQLPASVRQWWTSAETRISQVVERVTAAYVSPQLCNQELADVAQNGTKFKNMQIKVHPTVREVVAIYTVDECQMDLVITLPTNYPLGGPDVQCNRQICGTSHKQWVMQLKMCVRHQNGRISDGLALWNNNLNKKFDGVEECYICFAVLHPGTYQLPKLSCQTCRKKFHSACLYKWFSTSNKSTCPICRNLF